MITAVDCSIVRLNKQRMLPDYFNYYTQSVGYLHEIESLTSGATRKRISRKNLGKIAIPVPPIQEQTRIVAILEQAFADIEKIRANTEKNLKNARELFESYLRQVFSQRGEERRVRRIEEITKTSAGGTPLKSRKEYHEGGDIPWLLSGEVGVKDIKKSKNFITQSGLKNSSAKIFPKNTVLIAMVTLP